MGAGFVVGGSRCKAANSVNIRYIHHQGTRTTSSTVAYAESPDYHRVNAQRHLVDYYRRLATQQRLLTPLPTRSSVRTIPRRTGPSAETINAPRTARMRKTCCNGCDGSMVRWLHRRWGHMVISGLKDNHLQMYVGLPVFGFIDTTLRGCRRVE